MQARGIWIYKLPERQRGIGEVRTRAYTNIMYREGRPASMRTKQILGHLNSGPATIKPHPKI